MRVEVLGGGGCRQESGWHGVVVPDNPLGRDSAGRDRIVLTQSKGNPAPIPPELLGGWWQAAASAPSKVASDNYYQFQRFCRNSNDGLSEDQGLASDQKASE